jgi:endonuclease/exonuclease/phosphatase family metal-dependent hydrolase
VVVAGDLNEPPGAPAWEQLSDGLVDVAVAGALAFPTYPAAAPRSRIDAIFASPGLAAQPMDPRRPGLSAATDHLPVAADLGG